MTCHSVAHTKCSICIEDCNLAMGRYGGRSRRQEPNFGTSGLIPVTSTLTQWLLYMDIPSLGPELKSKEKTQNFQSTLQLCSCEEVDFSFLCAQTNPLTRLMRLPSKVILHGRCNVSAT